MSEKSEIMEEWYDAEKLYEKQLRAYLAMVKMFQCEICSMGGPIIRLEGGHIVTLCTSHFAAWHEFITHHKLWDELQDAKAEYDVAIYQHDEETAKERLRNLNAVRQGIYELFGEWLEMEKKKWEQQL